MNLPLCAFMATKMAVMPVPAFESYCERNSTACLTTGSTNRIEMNEQTWSKVHFINNYVNHLITPKRDQDVYGVNDYWELPESEGDCEDYALLKQKYLADNGIPKSNLLLTVVKDETGQGHAILTLRTTTGDFILDNKTDDIKPWSVVPYEFLARQSYRDYRLWLKVEKCTSK